MIGHNSGGGSIEIKNCYAAGAVTGAANTGGLIGYRNGGTITGCFWDIQRSGQSASAGGTGKTSAEMKTQATYKGWDFNGIWQAGGNQDYPRLRDLEL